MTIVNKSDIINYVFGGIPEWPKGADCKSVALASKVRILLPPYAQIAQSVEQRTENPRVAGSIPALGIIGKKADPI